ncbi:hypothetical protein K788_0007029 (plasmid) [Paraburkholderia caribensis MBA4]|uniref:Uncharacterized protein n=1 Tax=Paraburkholderia caribensis MBA4 TaxID=1323664 RepID=A0A0P0RPE8_9BURK|nr:hypothetical protein K788_0007029 [Paraburkholderia caribensis MBA4]
MRHERISSVTACSLAGRTRAQTMKRLHATHEQISFEARWPVIQSSWRRMPPIAQRLSR